jgi:hypothetical protein
LLVLSEVEGLPLSPAEACFGAGTVVVIGRFSLKFQIANLKLRSFTYAANLPVLP